MIQLDCARKIDWLRLECQQITQLKFLNDNLIREV